MKLKSREIKKEDKIKYLDYLYTAASSLESREEVKNFLRDLLTESERIMLGRRILIAQRLLEDKSYDEIIDELRVGKDTIMRVQRWLGDQSGGYEKTVKKLEKELSSRRFKSKDSRLEPFSFEWAKKKYPLHFLLFNLLDEFKSDKKDKKFKKDKKNQTKTV